MTNKEYYDIVKKKIELLDLYRKVYCVRHLKSHMLKNRAYVGNLVQGTFECQKIRSDKRVTDSEKWIITENHHEPIVDRKIFDKVQAKFGKRMHFWKKRNQHILAGRLK